MRRGTGQIQVIQSQLANLIAEINASQHRIGRLTLPLLLLGGTNTQTLTWTKQLPSASYNVSVQQDASIIGSVTVAVTAQDAGSVTIKTTATIAISAGAQLLVIAWTAP